MQVVKCKVSNNFLGMIFRDEVNLGESELPKDVTVAAIKGDYNESWFWVYFYSREFIDIDDTIPEVTLWFGPRRENA